MTSDLIRALARGSAAVMQSTMAKRLFEGRFSSSVTETLIKAGLDAPERLLFMTSDEIAALPGIDGATQQEVAAYRTRFQRPAAGRS